MPFKKTHQQGPHLSGPLFIGRANELLFFLQEILRPEEPTYNILSIYGDGGVGKTTLLHQFRNQAAAAGFKEYCLIARVDEQQAVPVSMMEKFAHQLHLSQKFEQALRRYQEALRLLPLSGSSSPLRKMLDAKAPDIAGALAENVPTAVPVVGPIVGPLVGPLLREGAKAATEKLQDHSQAQQVRSNVLQFKSPLDTLTQVFVDELNQMATTKVTLPSSSRTKRERRILLFFDTFEQVAEEVVPWLLHCLLALEIHPNIVFIIAGRDSLERSTATDLKHWLPYHDDQTLYSLQLRPFSYEETANYLTKRGITTKERIETIWHKSHGLPLYLSILTSSTQGRIDPTKDVVENFLHRIPDSEQIQRRLALDAAQFSRPFNLDDLEAFPYLSEQDRATLYNWLLRQPFIRPSSLEGRYFYHDLAQELFQRYAFQHSPNTYYATRRTLVAYYQRRLEHLQIIQEKNRYGPSDERLEVMLALATQRFFLPDEESHYQALLPLFRIIEYEDEEQMSALLRWLRQMIQLLSSLSGSAHAQQIAQGLLHFLEMQPQFDDPKDRQAWLAATDHLLTLVEHSSSSELLANMYDTIGWGYIHLKESQQALQNFERALALYPSASVYNGLGCTYQDLKEHQQTLDAFNHGLQHAPTHPHLYLHRGHHYREMKEYQQALNDYDQALRLDANFFPPYIFQARVYMKLKQYRKALANWNHMQEVAPEFPHPGLVPFRQGCAYLWLKDLPQATVCFSRSSEYVPTQPLVLWAKEWSLMCQTSPTERTLHVLQMMAEGDRYLACVCRGVLHWFKKDFEHALRELEYAATLPYDETWHLHSDGDRSDYWREWDAHFWLGMMYLMLGQEEEAHAAIGQALALEMPPVLLKPLRLFQQEKPKLYEQFVKPLLAAYDV